MSLFLYNSLLNPKHMLKTPRLIQIIPLDSCAVNNTVFKR